MLKLGDLGIPIHICLHYHHSAFTARMGPYQNRGSLVPMNMWRSLGIPVRHHTMTEAGYHNVAETTARDGEDPWATPTPSPSLHQGFKSDRSSVSTSSLVSSRSDRSEGSRHMHHGWCHREPGGHMKINLPVFKDEDTKDTITYQTWHWDLVVYHHAGCWDHTLLPYAICSLQGDLVRSSGTDVTLNGILAILDEHYNNVKALDTLNQELFQLWMGKKETVLDWRVHLLRQLQILVASFPECFPPDHVAELKWDHFYRGLPKWLKVLVAHLKASGNERTYSDYLQAVWKVEKEEAMEPYCNQTVASTSMPKVMSFFPLWKLKGSQPSKTPSVWVAHLEEESADKEECIDSEDPDGIEGITKEFIVHLARAV